MTLAASLLSPLFRRVLPPMLVAVLPTGASPRRTPPASVPQPGHSARPAPVATPDWLPDGDEAHRYHQQLDGQLGSCRRQGRLATLLLVEVLPADPHSAPGLMLAIGQRLRSRVRAVDLLTPLGAHRFAVLLLDAGDGRSAAVRKRLDTTLRGPYRVGAGLVHPLLRIGRAVHGLDGQHAAELLQAASLAPG